jgi:hypothetical protein
MEKNSFGTRLVESWNGLESDNKNFATAKLLKKKARTQTGLYLVPTDKETSG